jgi:hypothetical protein|tara:strand:- start:483 stop:1727 length:1245 start_codon:yes stop_codon:yes gene_type:complete
MPSKIVGIKTKKNDSKNLIPDNFSRPIVSPPIGFKLIAVNQIGNGKHWKVTYLTADSRAINRTFKINKKIRERLIDNCKWLIDWSYETAQIYEITFKVGIKKYIYVGLDVKCDPDYYGSSLVIHHYGEVYGRKDFFVKRILESLENITMTELCSIEQKYIRESKERSVRDGVHSINYTGANRRDSGPQIDVPKVGGQIITEAKRLGLDLRIASLKHGCIKPTLPPPPFDKASGSGMHIETSHGLSRIGFSFLRHRGSDNNIGLAKNILKNLEFDEDSIEILGSPSDYQLVMVMHNSSDPAVIANLYKRLVDMVWGQSQLFSNEPMDHNKTLPIKDILQECNVTISIGNFTIKRYKGNYIRIYREGSKSKESNSKEVLRAVDNEYSLEIEDKAWTQTQRAGKAVLDKLIKMKLEN